MIDDIPFGLNSKTKRIEQLSIREVKLGTYGRLNRLLLKELNIELFLIPRSYMKFISNKCFVCLKELSMNANKFGFGYNYNVCVECKNSVISKVTELKNRIFLLTQTNTKIKNEFNRLSSKEMEELIASSVDEEVLKIKRRQFKMKVKQAAEKKLFGKVKDNMRIKLTEEEKELVFQKFNYQCVTCGEQEGLHIHHKDGNPSNNLLSNLTILCGVCHKKVHMKVR